MQTSAQRRALSYLASKIHPQLPLTPRESERLLKLLTTSFRAQLDREHPLPSTSDCNGQSSRQLLKNIIPDNASPRPPPSSYSTASQHMDSILTNPLFAMRPKRRASDPSQGGVQELYRNPLGWFLNHVASGTADLSKAAICVDIIWKTNNHSVRDKAATQIAKWLQSSGLETSPEFLELAPSRLLAPLVTLLSKEGGVSHCWRWLEQTKASTDEQAIAFKVELVRRIVGSANRDVTGKTDLNEALPAFLKAYHVLCGQPPRSLWSELGLKTTRKVLRHTGLNLVRRIIQEGRPAIPADVYESFIETAAFWYHTGSTSLEAVLRLHHPTWPTAAPAIDFLKSKQARTLVLTDHNSKSGHSRVMRQVERRLIHLCLEAARQCLAAQNYTDAHLALHFAKEHFPELTQSAEEQPQSETQADTQSDRPAIRHLDVKGMRKERRKEFEERNMAMLDRLLPT